LVALAQPKAAEGTAALQNAKGGLREPGIGEAFGVLLFFWRFSAVLTNRRLLQSRQGFLIDLF